MKFAQYNQYSTYLVYLNLLIFLFFPFYSFYGLVILVGWLAFILSRGVIKIVKNVYFYGFVFISLSIFASASYHQEWDSLGFLLPFSIPLAFLLLVSSLHSKDYVNWLLLLIAAYLIIYGQKLFLTQTYFFKVQSNFFEIFSVILLFMPVFSMKTFKSNLVSGWERLLYLAISIFLVIVLITSLNLLFLILTIFAILLIISQKFRLGSTLVLLYVLFISAALIFWDYWSPYLEQDQTYLQLDQLAQVWQFDLVQNFSILGKGAWVNEINANNSYHQFYLSFGALGLIFFIFLNLSFIVAVSFSVKRQYAKDKKETNILWGYSCSTILFFVLCFFKTNFVSPAILYIAMAFWGIALGHITLVRSLKKERI